MPETIFSDRDKAVNKTDKNLCLLRTYPHLLYQLVKIRVKTCKAIRTMADIKKLFNTYYNDCYCEHCTLFNGKTRA